VRRYFFEILAVLLLLGGLVFFGEVVHHLGQRDYLGALLLSIIGVAVLNVGAELARLALIERER
jgi:H+/gluconate symporter-like permease